MVLKRKLPSQLAKESAKKATQDAADNSSVTTDFEVSPTAANDNSTPKTDKFTADALKEAASALAAEMGASSAPDLYLNDPFEDIEDAAPQASAPSAPEEAPESVPADEVVAPTDVAPQVAAPDELPEAVKQSAPLKDTFADILPQKPQPEPEPTKADIELEKMANVVSDIDDKPEPETQPEVPTPTPEPTPEPEAPEPEQSAPEPEVSAPVIPAGLKRKSRNKRKRARVATSDNAHTAPTPPQQAPKASEPQTETAKPGDMELAAQHKPDEVQTKSNVDRAFKEMAGVPDPADQEIEAAYIPPAEVEPEAVQNAPKPDISKLISTEAETPPAPEPTKAPPPQEAPKSFAEAADAVAPEPELKEEPAPEPERAPEKAPTPEVKKEPELEPQEVAAATIPPVSFAEPQSFADIASDDKKSEPLPWEQEASNAEASDDAWELEPAQTQTAPTPDVYGGMDTTTAADTDTTDASVDEPEADSKGAGFSMPFLNKFEKTDDNAADAPASDSPKSTKKKSNLPPPELPSEGTVKVKSFNAKPLLLVAALGVVGFIGYKVLTNKDSTQERVARFTGALDNTPETLPAQTANNNANASGGQKFIQPQQVITQDELTRLNKELEEDLARLNTTESNNAAPSNAQIDFVDVTQKEANTPIVADPDEPLPGEKGFVASLQDAISSERKKRGMESSPSEKSASNPDLPPEERRIESLDMQAQVQAELEAYRKALSGGDSALPIKPGQFFGTVNEQGVLLPPKTRQAAGDAGLPESEIYTENPYNLPVLAEPEAEPAPTVRSLNDFDVAMFEPPKAKVRIPQGLKPRLRASDFPEVTALSFIPNKGMIAHANGREGVLLIGEMIEGWELFAVTQNHAEFRSGQRKYYVNLD